MKNTIRILAMLLVVAMTVAMMSVTAFAEDEKQTAEAPAGLYTEDETFAGKEDGRIFGLTTAMEYSRSATEGYKKVTDRYMTFAPGVWYVRYAETATKYASAPVALTIESGENAVITFVADGEVVATVEQLYGWQLETPEIPEKEGYTQVAPVWSVTDFNTVQGDMTVEAVYTINIYNVTYVADGNVVKTVSVKHGDDVAAVEAPAKDGYTVAWDNDGKAIKADTTITAVYTAIETEASVTETPETLVEDIHDLEENGCGASVGVIGVGFVLVASIGTALVANRKED